MSEALSQLQRVQGVQATVVVARNGALLESSLSAGAQRELTGSLAAAIFGAVDESIERIDLGSLTNCMFEGRTGTIHMVGAGGHVLVAVTSKHANAGLVRLGLQRAAASLSA